MAFVAWSETMSTGIAEIDEQHRTLIGMLNDLHDAMISGQGGGKASGIVERLVEYAMTHFDLEERLMATAAASELAAHKAEHEDFKKRIGVFKREVPDWGVFVSMDMIVFLRDWLTNHIMEMDRKDVNRLAGR